MLRMLAEEALAFRRAGQVKRLTADHSFLERFEGPVPDFGSTYRVVRDEWNDELTERVIYEWTY